MVRVNVRNIHDQTINKSAGGIEVFEAGDHVLLQEIPPPPTCLNEDGIFWWTYYAGLLIECGNLSRLFLASLKNFCMVLQLLDAYEAEIVEQGIFIDVPRKYKGEEYYERAPNPLIGETRRMYDQADRLASSLGFTLYTSKLNAVDATGGTLTAPVSSPPSSDLGSPPETIPYQKQA